jgi:hypothetical protein
MLKVGTIKKIIMPEGVWAGTACILADFTDESGLEKDSNTIIEEILKLGLRSVLVKGIVRESPELKDILIGLSTKGKVITLVTEATDLVELIRPLKYTRVFMRLPILGIEEAKIELRNLPLMKDDDEVKIIIKSKEDYAGAKTFLKNRLMTRPTILFYLSSDLENPEEIINQYLEDCGKFIFKSRIINAYTK